VESVYATIEVKATLTPKELDASLQDIRGLREIGSRKHVVISRYEDVGGNKKVVSEKRISTVPPRSYVVAFRQRGLGRSYDDFAGALLGGLEKVDTHVHGVCVLSTDWFAARKPMTTPAMVVGQEGEALLNLYLSILRDNRTSPSTRWTSRPTWRTPSRHSYPSLPRKRESRARLRLDSRVRGNDERRNRPTGRLRHPIAPPGSGP